MKLLVLSNTLKPSLIDDEDYDRINQYNWCANFDGHYICGRIGDDVVSLARFILGPCDIHNAVVDHKNGDWYDNQKSNLRNATNSENLANRGLNKNNTSGYKGIDWDSKNRKYRVRIKVMYKEIWLGRHNTLQEAINAYNNAAIKHFGEFARLQ